MNCIDSSVAAKWLFTEEHSAEATTLINTTLAAADPIIAPHMLPSEVTNIIRQRVRRGTVTRQSSQALLTRFMAIPIELRAPATLYQRALAIANDYNLPASYDAHYVALADMAGATFWTADLRLIRALGDAFPFVRSIADYQPS